MHIPSEEQLRKISSFKRSPTEKFTSSFLMENSSNLEAFLYSNALFKFTKEARNNLLKELLNKSNEAEQTCSLEYLQFAFGRADWCYEALKNILKGCSLENLLSYCEFCLNRMIKTNTDINGDSFPKEIVYSKHDFMLSVVPTILFIAHRESLPTTTKKLLKDSDQSKLVLLIIAQYHSITKQIMEVMKGGYIPKPIDYINSKYGAGSSEKLGGKCKYFLQRVPEFLDYIEIYNDLNYTMTYTEERDPKDLLSTLKESGVIKNYIEGEILHFDMSKGVKFEEVREIKKVRALIENIYGPLKSEVSYGDLKFTIENMISLARKIKKLSVEISSHRQKNSKHITIYKQTFENLSRQLKLSILETEILPTFVADLHSNNFNAIESLPFFTIDGFVYMFPPTAVELCYEKVIDKILSQKGFIVRSPKKHKGIMFEDNIIQLFSSNGFEVGQINRNERKNIPEIDALVNFDDDNIFVIEAKCSIKPEERLEVYSFIENHLSKAASQLVKRVDFLKLNPTAAKERLKFSIDNKNIIPILVTNHSFFTGHKLVMESGLVIYCIDEILLRKIISSNYIPSWHYTGYADNYVPKDRNLKTTSEQLEAILNPTANLSGKAHRVIQPLSYGAAIEIYKRPSIDRLEQFRRMHTDM